MSTLAWNLDPGLDLFPLLAAVMAALTCGLLGNFLVLRRQSLMGDAISHSVLPGLVIAFLVTQSRGALPMFIGAALAGVATVVLVELVKRLGRVEPGAAMGVVFCVLFALGVLLIERAAVRRVDLDADCVLHGQLEMLVWYGAPDDWAGVLSSQTLEAAPRQVWVLLGMLGVTVVFLGLVFKELRLASFDPQLATSQGFSATALHYALMVLVAAATVASFEAVGSILVIAMLICPAATARLLTDRLSTQIGCSAAVAIATGVLGYAGATVVPAAFGHGSVNAAGSMTVAAGVLLIVAIVASPSHGVVAARVRNARLAATIASDDVLAALYRAGERGQDALSLARLRDSLGKARAARGVRAARRRGLVMYRAERVAMTPDGEIQAAAVIRRHREWETYLVDRVGLAPDHVHETAEILEHLRAGRHEPITDAPTDPHGKPIPNPRGLNPRE